MGCHTWCYVNIPEKQDDWKRDFKDMLIKECQDEIDLWSNAPVEELKTYVDIINEENKEFLDRYEENKKSGNLDSIMDGFQSIAALEKYIETIKNPMDEEGFRQYMISFCERSLEAMDLLKTTDEYLQFKGDDAIGYMHFDNGTNNILASPSKFGLYIYKDGKIYRETNALSENGVLSKYGTYYDMFRIKNYEEPDCYSYEETMKVCERNNVDWTLTFEGPGEKRFVNSKEDIEHFWKKYPDAIIEFA